MKRCSRCKEEKPYDEFHKSSSTKDGYKYMCKSCRQLDYAEKYSPEQVERIQLRNQNKKRCPGCNTVKEFSEFSKSPNRFNGLHGYCKECRKRRDKQYREENREESRHRAKLRMRKWAKNPENAEKNRRCARVYYHNNKNSCYNRKIAWRKTFRGRLLTNLQVNRRRNQELAVKNTLLPWHIELLLLIQSSSCAKCGKKFTKNNPYTLDHIVPLSKGAGLTLKNTQLLHRGCNASKGTKTIEYRDAISLYYSELT